MKVVNVHQRVLNVSAQRVAALVATLGSPDDQLWPRKGWPRMVLDRPLAVGASGGHGPIRYDVEACEPQFVAFRFRMRGVHGWHAFEVLDATERNCVLEHRMEVRLSSLMALKWLAVIRPQHDGCVEDLLSQAQSVLGETPRPVRRSAYVDFLLRHMSAGRKSRSHGKHHHAA